MPGLTLMITAIFVERMAIVFSAFVSIYFGWNLFRSNIYVDQEGNLSMGEWKVELKRVGPGIFFSLFGSAVLIAAFVHPMNFSTNGAAGAQPPISLSGFLPTAEADQLRLFRAVNTVGQVRDAIASTSQANAQFPAPVSILPFQATELVQAADRLEQVRDQFVAKKFGGDNLQTWKDNYQKFHDAPTSLDPKTRDKMVDLDPKITPWMKSNMAEERK
jgi:hypothetical protein